MLPARRCAPGSLGERTCLQREKSKGTRRMSKLRLPPGGGAGARRCPPLPPTPRGPAPCTSRNGHWERRGGVSRGSGSGREAARVGGLPRFLKFDFFFCFVFLFLYFFFVILLLFNPPIGESRGTGARSQGKGWKNKMNDIKKTKPPLPLHPEARLRPVRVGEHQESRASGRRRR